MRPSRAWTIGRVTGDQFLNRLLILSPRVFTCIRHSLGQIALGHLFGNTGDAMKTIGTIIVALIFLVRPLRLYLVRLRESMQDG
jgi:hypothetical protein